MREGGERYSTDLASDLGQNPCFRPQGCVPDTSVGGMFMSHFFLRVTFHETGTGYSNFY